LAGATERAVAVDACPRAQETPRVDPRLLAFLGIAALVIVTPGPDTVLTVRNTLGGGRTGGLGTALGVATGQAIWTVATSAGIATLLLASAPAFAALRLMTLAWLAGYAVVVTKAGAVLARPRIRRALEGATGLALVAFGLHLALGRRKGGARIHLETAAGQVRVTTGRTRRGASLRALTSRRQATLTCRTRQPEEAARPSSGLSTRTLGLVMGSSWALDMRWGG
jgi:hypothetical protein